MSLYLLQAASIFLLTITTTDSLYALTSQYRTLFAAIVATDDGGNVAEKRRVVDTPGYTQMIVNRLKEERQNDTSQWTNIKQWTNSKQ